MSDSLPVPYEPAPPDDPEHGPPPARRAHADLSAYVPAEGQGLDWRRHLSAIFRYKWAVLAVTALGGAAGMALSRAVPAQYVVQSTIWVESSRGESRTETEPIHTGEVLSASGWVDLLTSYVVLDSVVLDLRLYLSEQTPGPSLALESFQLQPRFTPGAYRLVVDGTGRRYTLQDGEGRIVERGAVGDSIGAGRGFAWAPPAEHLGAGQVIEFTVDVPRDVARNLADNLKPQMDPAGNIIRVELAGKNPERITEILNAVTERYVAVAAELKRSKLEELTHILYDQLAAAESSLRQAETALEDFQVRTAGKPRMINAPAEGGAGSEGTSGDPIFTDYFQLRLDRERLERDRRTLERVLAQVRGGTVSVTALEFVPAVAASSEMRSVLEELTAKRTELRALRYRYTGEHRQVKQLEGDIATLERHTIPALLERMIGEIAQRQRELGGDLGSITSELRQMPTRAVEEARLQRRVAVAENLYTTLRQRYEVARVAAISAIPDMHVLDEATAPYRPVKHYGSRILLIALAAGLGVGMLGASVAGRLDTRIRFPNEVTDGLGLPILGGIPHVKRGRLVTDAPGSVVEAFRTVRLGLVHAYGSAGPLVTTISSPGAGEGKSFFSANLALTFASVGCRTLLIDGDVRRGTLHRLLGVDRRPGLTDLLTGDATLETALRETLHPGLHLIGCGTRLPSGPELLTSDALRRTLLEMRQRYDVILVDSSPLGAGADAFILGTLTGNLVLVLRTGTTSRVMTEAKLGLVDRLPIRTLGAVLNDIPGRGTYYHHAYMPYAILPGYEAEMEGTALPPGESRVDD